MPRLAEREDGRVDQRAHVQPLEALTEVLESHPASPHGRHYDDIEGGGGMTTFELG